MMVKLGMLPPRLGFSEVRFSQDPQITQALRYSRGACCVSCKICDDENTTAPFCHAPSECVGLLGPMICEFTEQARQILTLLLSERFERPSQ